MEKNTNNYGVGLYQDGVFYFTNPGLFKSRNRQGEETYDFSCLWNNKEYTFKAKTTVPLIIANTTPEETQHIRKVFAKNYATAWFFQTPRYKKMVKDGGFIPATYNEDEEYQKVIQACLTPLPKSQAEVAELPRPVAESSLKGTKAISKNANLNETFKDYEIPELGTV